MMNSMGIKGVVLAQFRESGFTVGEAEPATRKLDDKLERGRKTGKLHSRV